MSSDNEVSQLRSSMHYDTDTSFSGTSQSPPWGGGGWWTNGGGGGCFMGLLSVRKWCD